MRDADERAGSVEVRGVGERRMMIVAGIGFGVVVAAFWVWWPAGVALGLVYGTCIVAKVGLGMHDRAPGEADDLFDPAEGDPVGAWPLAASVLR